MHAAEVSSTIPKQAHGGNTLTLIRAMRDCVEGDQLEAKKQLFANLVCPPWDTYRLQPCPFFAQSGASCSLSQTSSPCALCPL